MEENGKKEESESKHTPSMMGTALATGTSREAGGTIWWFELQRMEDLL